MQQGDDQEQGGEEIGEDNIEEARTAKVGRSPYSPTQQEGEVHEPTHLPYRSWREVCVAGRRDNAPHRTLKPKSIRSLK